MEEVRTSIEKIFDAFEANHKDSPSAKRLNYSFLSNSGSDQFTPSRKRRRGIDDTELSLNHTGVSSLNLTSASQASQWETRLLKADLIEANSKVVQLTKEMEDRMHVHKNLEQMYESKIKNMQNQIEVGQSKAKEQDRCIKHLRKRGMAEKDELTRVKNDLVKQKQQYDAIVGELRKSNTDLESNLRQSMHNMNATIQTLQLQLAECEAELQGTRDELDALQDRQDDLKDKASQVDQLTADLEQERFQLATAKRQIGELESEIVGHGEWKNLSKVFQARLAKVTDLERECERLTRDNKNLHDTIGNKLLLEEQVHDLKARLQGRERTSDAQVDLSTQIQALEQEIVDWKRLARDYCPNAPTAVSFLRAYIDDLQKKNLIYASEAGGIQRDKASFSEQLAELRKQNEHHVKNAEMLSTTLRNYRTTAHRMQKKLMLIAKERDCFKTLLENYEKDLTISVTAASAEASIDAELRARLEVVEKSLSGYKEICKTLEQELELARAAATGDMGPLQTTNQQHEHMNAELAKLRIENERLQRRKDELELFVEQMRLKESLGPSNGEKEYKVVHMAMNPSEEAHESYKNEVDKLKAEIERLKRKNRKLEEEHQDMTNRHETATMNMTTNIQEITSLRNQIQALENKQQRYKEIYRTASQEFREVIYLLFGYRVDRINNSNYRISSVYANSEDEYLNFRLNEMGELDMLESDYSLTLVDMISNYLAEHHSMPAFLSSLTLDLFNRQTMTVE